MYHKASLGGPHRAWNRAQCLKGLEVSRKFTDSDLSFQPFSSVSCYHRPSQWPLSLLASPRVLMAGILRMGRLGLRHSPLIGSTRAGVPWGHPAHDTAPYGAAPSSGGLTVLLEQSLLSVLCGCFRATATESSSYDRACRVCEATIFPIWPFAENIS